jgi:hypothetical protein
MVAEKERTPSYFPPRGVPIVSFLKLEPISKLFNELDRL